MTAPAKTAQAKTKTQHFSLLEIARQSSSVRIDRDKGRIYGVKILGAVSKNGKEYTEQARRTAIPLYEGKSVYFDHPTNAAGMPDEKRKRKHSERFGRLVNVREDNGLFGDLDYLKTHPLAEMTLETAERMPETFGLSHNAEGDGHFERGKAIITKISLVRTVDLVTEPATTQSLFEELSPMDPVTTPLTPDVPDAGGGDMTLQMFLDKATEIFNGDGDPATKAKQISAIAKTLLKVSEQIDAAVSGTAATADATTQTTTEEVAGLSDPKLIQLLEEVRTLRGKEESRVLLESVGIAPEPALVDALASLPATKRQALVDTWPKGQKAAGQKPPRSAAQFDLVEEQRQQASVAVPKFADNSQRASFLRG